MDFAYDATTERYRAKLLEFMDEHVYPAEPVLAEQTRTAADPWAPPPIIEELKKGCVRTVANIRPV